MILTTAAMASIATVMAGQRSCASPTSLDERFDAPAVFQCTFDAATGTDLNGWPNGWSRDRSPGYPHYVEIRVDSAGPANSEGRSLRMELDGGAAAAYSPAIPASASFKYVFEAIVQTEGLHHDRAFLSATFYDSGNKVLERCVSSAVEGTASWTRLRIGPVAPSQDATHHVVIGLHVEPGSSADLKGSAWFGDVWMGKLPRIILSADRRNQFYLAPDQPQVVCMASGFSDRMTAVDFQLLDVEGRELQRARSLLEVDAVGPASGPQVLAGRAVWRPSLPDVGYYRVRCSFDGDNNETNSSEVSLALVRPQAVPKNAEFGWALPEGPTGAALDSLSEIAEQAGINWLKLPVWDTGSDPRRLEQLATFAERMHNAGVNVVGTLADPPLEVRKRFDASDPLLAAQIFSARTEAWFPSLEPVVSRLSQSVRYWQLGRDGDFSFVNFAETMPTIQSVRKQFGALGQKPQIGCSWPDNRPLPIGGTAWNFVAISAAPFDAASQVPPASKRGEHQLQRWIFVEPVAIGTKTASECAADLAHQMLAAKLEGADGIFAPRVLNSQRGLLNGDGSAGELLLPWRTTALALGGSDYVGGLRLEHGSMNHIFSRNGQLAMVLWNDKPCEERVVLGEKVRQINLWGAEMQVASDDQNAKRLRAGEPPSFVTCLDEPLVRWQMAVALAQRQWPTTFGEPLPNEISVTNTFPQPVTGTVRCVLPERWRMTPRELAFKLPPGESASLPFEVLLPLDASTGPQEVRFDFDLTADRRFQFSVYRSVKVGDNSVYAELTTRLDDSGELIVEQKLFNTTDQPLSFKCSLFAPDRRRMTIQLTALGHGSDTKTYRLPDGKSLLGKTLWLHAEDATGQRILNYRFAAQR